MLYNKTEKRIQKMADCLTCPYFDKKIKSCNGGIGKTCFEYDPLSKTAIDPITQLPIKLD